MEHVFHQSWLNLVTHCPEQARVELNKPRDDQTTDAAARGTAAHAAIEWTIQEWIMGIDNIELETAHDIIDHELALLSPWKRTKFNEDRVYELAHKAYDTWCEFIWPELDPEQIVGVEHDFRVPLIYSERNVVLEGTMDLYGAPIWDWKTAGRAYEPWEYQRWAIQPTVYTYAQAYENDELGLGGSAWPDYVADFRYGIMLDNGQAQILDVTRDERHWKWLAQQCDRIVDLIEAELDHWPLNDTGWWCSDKWCDNWANCKGSQFGTPAEWQSVELTVAA